MALPARSAPSGATDASDALWVRIRADAREAAASDAALAPLMQTQVLQQPAFESALAAVLSARLASPLLDGTTLGRLVVDALETAPAIGLAIRCDIRAAWERDPACAGPLEPLLFYKGVHALSAYRVSHWLWTGGRRQLARLLQSIVAQCLSVDIHPGARIGRGILMDHAHGIVVGETAVIEDDVSILHNVTLGGTGKETGDRHPKVRAGVLLGAGALILGGIEVGRGAKVGAGSVVMRAVPPHVTVAGSAARVVGRPTTASPALEMNHETGAPPLAVPADVAADRPAKATAHETTFRPR